MNTTVKLDTLNRIYVPKKAMETLDWETGDKLNLEVIDSKVVISKGKQDKTCKNCNSVFVSSFTYCPFDGELLVDRSEVPDEEK